MLKEVLAVAGLGKMNRISLALVGAVFAVGAAMTPAFASTDYTWTFTAKGFDAHGMLTTDSGPDVAGNIIDITGSVNGDTITGIVPTSPFGETSADSLFTFDNKLDPTGDKFVDNPGLLFTTASGMEYNLYEVQFFTAESVGLPNNDPTGPGGYNLDAGSAKGYGDSINGDFSIALASTAPEPADWIMMLAGFAVLGSMVRMNRKVGLSAV